MRLELEFRIKDREELKHPLIIIVLVFQISACGTMRTLGEEPIEISSPKYSGSQPCQSIIRIYSGVRYDHCVVNKGDGSDWELNGYLVWDFPFSFVLDSIVLPYTIFKQIKDGSLVQRYPKEVYP